MTTENRIKEKYNLSDQSFERLDQILCNAVDEIEKASEETGVNPISMIKAAAMLFQAASIHADILEKEQLWSD